MSLKDWLLLTAISFMWGGSFFFNSILIDAVGPWSVTAGRVTIGAIGVWLYLLLSGRPLPTDPALWAYCFMLGTITYALPFSAIAWGQIEITGGLASIINAMVPITTLIVTHFWPGGEKATPLKSLGVLTGFLGAFVLMWPKLKAGAMSELLAYLAVYSATICYAVGLNLARPLKSQSPIFIAAAALTGAAMVSLVFAAWVEGPPATLNTRTLWSFAGIGLISTSLAFSLMYTLLPRIGAVNFSMVTFMIPITSILLGSTFLDERLETAQLLGMLVIFLGLLFIDGRLFRARRL